MELGEDEDATDESTRGTEIEKNPSMERGNRLIALLKVAVGEPYASKTGHELTPCSSISVIFHSE